jgi:transposase
MIGLLADHGHWKTTTFIAALGHDQIDAPCIPPHASRLAWGPRIFAGPINGDRFRAWTEKELAPTLHPGDNLSSHKVVGVKAAIEARGATVLYLPPYSPDLDPTEQLFAKLKHFLRKAEARTVEALHEAIGKLIDLFAPNERLNYMQNAGYST